MAENLTQQLQNVAFTLLILLTTSLSIKERDLAINECSGGVCIIISFGCKQYIQGPAS